MLTFTAEATEALKSMRGMNAEHRARIREIRAQPDSGWPEYDKEHKLNPIAELKAKIEANELAISTFEATERIAYDEVIGQPIGEWPESAVMRGRSEKRLEVLVAASATEQDGRGVEMEFEVPKGLDADALDALSEQTYDEMQLAKNKGDRDALNRKWRMLTAARDVINRVSASEMMSGPTIKLLP
jgi:hypothetical protein